MNAQATWTFHKSSLLRFYERKGGKEAKPYPGLVDDILTGLEGLSTNSICEFLKYGNNCTQKFCSGQYCLDQLDAVTFSVRCCDG